MTELFINVLLPIAVPKPFTYSVSEEFKGFVQFGIRVEVPFGKNKLFAGIVVDVNVEKPQGYKVKNIISIIDKSPVITNKQWELWKWMAEYYCCNPGEVMNAALPAHLKLSSETQFHLNPFFKDQLPELSEKEYLVAEALQVRNSIAINDIRLILELKNVMPIVNGLIKKGIIVSEKEIKQKYTVLKAQFLRLKEPYRSDYETLRYVFDDIQNSEKQTQALLGYLQKTRSGEWIKLVELLESSEVSRQVISGLVKKNIFEIAEREISRINSKKVFEEQDEALNHEQTVALNQIREYFISKNVVLLHGITGSGKTHIYTELSKDYLDKGGQILYLLPEIALTTQIISRLKKVFGNDIVVYHSRMNNQERVEVWEAVMSGKKIILSARSGLFLPFKDLRMIIVDEEHDSSYKQDDPAPRYQGRDLSIFMASLYGAKVILGSATPSIETFKNTKDGKYGYVSLMQRYGGIELPEFIVVDIKEEAKLRRMQAHFSTELIEYLQFSLERKEQAILFQNRRGFAPVIECSVCNWSLECPNCDVNLTYHKSTSSMKCHYCGYNTQIPTICPACGNLGLEMKGLGTERIEDELSIYLPDARVARLDLDTTRKKDAVAKLFSDFENRKIDILVGTQMVTKGLDFDNIGLVGIINLDQLYKYPDFRSNERAFQLITQVAGRAGRKDKRGKVILQTSNIAHPLLQLILENDFIGFYEREIEERKNFFYPPYSRLIHIRIRHKSVEITQKASNFIAVKLREHLAYRVQGPAEPSVSRIRGLYIRELLIKLERKNSLMTESKKLIMQCCFDVTKLTGCSNVRVTVNVDPQ